MARSEIPVVEVIRDGVTAVAPVISDAVNHHYFKGNEGKTWLEIESTDAGTQTVSVLASPRMETDGLEVLPHEFDCPPGTVTKAGPWRMRTFNQDAGEGSVFVNVPVSTTLKLRAFYMEPAT